MHGCRCISRPVNFPAHLHLPSQNVGYTQCHEICSRTATCRHLPLRTYSYEDNYHQKTRARRFNGLRDFDSRKAGHLHANLHAEGKGTSEGGQAAGNARGRQSPGSEFKNEVNGGRWNNSGREIGHCGFSASARPCKYLNRSKARCSSWVSISVVEVFPVVSNRISLYSFSAIFSFVWMALIPLT
jgi:hypothetical protein